jgi:Fic family protein
MDEDPTDLSNPIWHNPDFPGFYRSESALMPLENSIRREAGELPETANFGDVMVAELMSNSAIEGVILSQEKLKSSLLGNFAGPADKREKNAVVAMKLAIEHCQQPLTHELIQQINGLFNESPDHAGQYVGGVVLVKPGRFGERTIMDRGVEPDKVDAAMSDFVKSFNSQTKSTPLFNAIAGHVHFEKIHPFSDGNGRTGRVLMNMALMRDCGLAHPLALSRAIQLETKVYYECLGRSSLDLTQTIKDLAPMMSLAFKETARLSELTELRKQSHVVELNPRQRKAIDWLIAAELENSYVGNFSSPKYEALTKTSESTALRDLGGLVKAGLLVKKGASKNSHYMLPIGKSEQRNIDQWDVLIGSGSV